MEHQKDYSLLRPFDLEAAKAGAPLTNNNDVMKGRPTWVYAAGPDTKKRLVVTILSTGEFANVAPVSCFAMAPLCWVEGKPVYAGDVLFDKNGRRLTAYESALIDTENFIWVKEEHSFSIRVKNLTWTAPKVKREGFVAIKHGTKMSRDEAEHHAEMLGKDWTVGRIEWEEPAG